MPPQTFAEKRRIAKKMSIRLGVTSLVLTAGLGALHVHLNKQWRSQTLDLTHKKAMVQQQLTALETHKAKQSEATALRAQAQASIAPQLSVDLNPVFSAIENINIASARLQAFELNLQQQRLQVSYQLDQLSKVEPVHQQLSDGYSPLQCELSHMQTTNTAVMAHWRCRY